MASILAALRMAVDQPPTLNEALSGVLGSVSLAAWICLLLPQLIANYKAKSAEGLSMAFLFVWLTGDVANLSGALVTNLAPTAIALAMYFCFADVVLIGQCLYYNTLNARRAVRNRRRNRRRRRSSAAIASSTDDADAGDGADGNDADTEEGDSDEDGAEEEPLLARRRSSSIGLPGSHRRHATNARLRAESSNMDALTRIITGEGDTPDRSPWLHNALSLLAVWVVGGAGWFVSYRMGAWDSAPEVGDPEAQEAGTIVGLSLGYFSALCYLCARIPQIVKNYREKSCEGLALLFFLLSLTGNFTYGASLFAYSQDGEYLLKALPWLLGSLGTMVEDCIIFVQFKIYAPQRRPKANGTNGAA